MTLYSEVWKGKCESWQTMLRRAARRVSSTSSSAERANAPPLDAEELKDVRFGMELLDPDTVRDLELGFVIANQVLEDLSAVNAHT